MSQSLQPPLAVLSVHKVMLFRTIGLFIITFVMWLGGLVWFIDDMPQGSPAPQTKTKAIVVLTGGNNRISEGLRLLSQKKSPTLMISGVQKGTPLQAVIKASGYQGAVNHRRIALDYNSTTTVENARNVAKWCRQKKISSIRLVTANYHMKRTLIEFNHSLKNVKIIPHAVNPLDSSRNSWCKDYKVFCLYMNEYHKYLGALIRMNVQYFYEKEYKTK